MSFLSEEYWRAVNLPMIIQKNVWTSSGFRGFSGVHVLEIEGYKISKILHSVINHFTFWQPSPTNQQ